MEIDGKLAYSNSKECGRLPSTEDILPLVTKAQRVPGPKRKIS